MRRPSMPAELRERYGPVVPTWEERAEPLPLVPLTPDTPDNIQARRDAAARALGGRPLSTTYPQPIHPSK